METVHDRLIIARKKSGFTSARSAALANGWSENTYRSHETGRRGIPLKEMRKYSRRFGVKYLWLLHGSSVDINNGVDITPIRKGMEVLGEVAGGVWLEVDHMDDFEHDEIPVSPDHRYGEVRQYALKVVGDSMNKIFPSGQYVICIESFGREPRNGDLVVVKRNQPGLTEVTVKRVKIVGSSIELWPESTNQNHQSPIHLGSNGDSHTIEIVAFVIGRYEPISNPNI